MPVLQKGFAIERRLTVLVATHNVLPPKQAAPFQPDTVDQPGRNLRTAVGKLESGPGSSLRQARSLISLPALLLRDSVNSM